MLRNLDNVVYDMRNIYPNFEFDYETTGNLTLVTVKRSPGRFMTVEFDIDYNQNSIVACVMNNFHFGNVSMTSVMNTMLSMFG